MERGKKIERLFKFTTNLNILSKRFLTSFGMTFAWRGRGDEGAAPPPPHHPPLLRPGVIPNVAERSEESLRTYL